MDYSAYRAFNKCMYGRYQEMMTRWMHLGKTCFQSNAGNRFLRVISASVIASAWVNPCVRLPIMWSNMFFTTMRVKEIHSRIRSIWGPAGDHLRRWYPNMPCRGLSQFTYVRSKIQKKLILTTLLSNISSAKVFMTNRHWWKPPIAISRGNITSYQSRPCET